jgi:hypothetical protein
MTALSGPRKLTNRQGDSALAILIVAPVAATKVLHQGALCALDGGYCVPFSTKLGLIPLGVNEEKVDNTSGSNGAKKARLRRGTYTFANSAGGDAIAQTDLGKVCYGVDDQTVALTDGNGTRSKVGRIMGLDPVDSQVLVEIADMGDANAGVGGKAIVSWPFDLADLAAVDVVAKFQPGFPGKIVKFQATVLKPATTAAKAATITPQINTALGADTPVTGGGLALTSANMTPIGATVQSAAITGANTFTAADGISLLGSAITAFVEGRVALELTLASL